MSRALREALFSHELKEEEMGGELEEMPMRAASSEGMEEA